MLTDAAGVLTTLIKDPQEYTNPRFSRDGKRVAFDPTESGKRDVWVYDPQREIKTRLTLGPGEHEFAIWSADGERLAYSQADGIYWVRSGGGGEPERLLESRNSATPISFSPDGKMLAYSEERPATRCRR